MQSRAQTVHTRTHSVRSRWARARAWLYLRARRAHAHISACS